MKVRIPGTRITGLFDGKHYKDLSSGMTAKSPTGFARLAYPDARAVNGWKTVEYQDKKGSWRLLDTLRTHKDPFAPFRRVAPSKPVEKQKETVKVFEDSYLKFFY